MSLLKEIFSVYNIDKHKVIKIMGIKIKFRKLIDEINELKINQTNRIEEINELRINQINGIKEINELKTEIQVLHVLLNRSVDIRNVPEARGNLREFQLMKVKFLEITDLICKKHNLQYWLDFGTLLGAHRHKGFIPWDDDIDISMLKEDYFKVKEIFEEELKSTKFYVCTGKNETYQIYRIKHSDFAGIEMQIDIFPYDFHPDEIDTEEKRAEFKNKILNCRDMFYEKYKLDNFASGKLTLQNMQNEIEEIENLTLFKDVSRSSENPKTIYRLPVSMSVSNTASIYPAENAFPLTECEFEGKYYPVPKNSVEYLSKAEGYGDIMEFPTATTEGTHHVLSVLYDKMPENAIKDFYTEAEELISKLKNM